jgi:hypothetical protein
MAAVTTSSLFLVLIEESVIPMGLDRDAVWPVEDFWILDDRQVNVELVSGWLTLTQLKVRDVGFALGKLAKRLSTASVRLARMILIQAIRNAMVNDLVVRNVADLAALRRKASS